MAKKSPAIKLQEELLEKGFRSIELCDDQDDHMVTITHYSLSKRDKPSENPDPCLMYKWFSLGSDEAVEILEKWMDQTAIHPDPRSL
jgi:hypothetical protein